MSQKVLEFFLSRAYFEFLITVDGHPRGLQQAHA